VIKHISFDFWDTLYKGNPGFRANRSAFIEKKYGIEPEKTHIAVKKAKEICDGLSEKTMCTVDATTQAWHLLDQLGVASIGGARELCYETERFFLDNPPIPLFEVSNLNALKDKGVSISISCNTGLISGSSIVQMLGQTKVLNVFDFTVFSDHIRYFKPNPFFLDYVVRHPQCKANNFEEVLHVGDNDNTDGYLCQLTGANYLKVENRNLDFSEINTFLK
jgi:FMN phosphatase YigB (HAD superfamily)